MSSLTQWIWWSVAGVLVAGLVPWIVRGRLGNGKSPRAGEDDDRATAATCAPAAPPIDTRAGGAASAAAAAKAINGNDDLEVIEGIGPRIAAILTNSGIWTFHELADSSVPALSAILEKAGPRFKLANPSSWPEQARLAAAGKWPELKIMQESLVANERMRETNI